MKVGLLMSSWLNLIFQPNPGKREDMEDLKEKEKRPPILIPLKNSSDLAASKSHGLSKKAIFMSNWMG